MINVGAESKTSERAVKMAEEYGEGVYSAVGLHPSHLVEQEVEYKENGETIKYKSKPEEFDYNFYLNLAKNKKVVAIGECGLDYGGITNEELRTKQKEIFVRHLDLAKEVNKPVIIHCRDAHDDLLKILHWKSRPPSGVMHFLPATWNRRKIILIWVSYISFSGVITFPPRKGKVSALTTKL